MLHVRGSDEKGVTSIQDKFNVNGVLKQRVYYSELTKVGTFQRFSEPKADDKLMDLLSPPPDNSLSYGPSDVHSAKKLPRCHLLSESTSWPTPEEALIDGINAHLLLSHPVLLDEANDKFHDPSKQEPWKPLLAFDNQFTKAHESHLRNWQAGHGNRDLHEASYEPYEVHDKPCMHFMCRCDEAPGRKSSEISKALDRVKCSKKAQSLFYRRLEMAHTTENSKTSGASRCVDMHGIYRAFDAPDAPIGIFSKAEQDLFKDQNRLRLRTAEIKKGTTKAKLDEMELKVLRKTQAQLQSQRVQAEDALFAQHRVFPVGRKHPALKLYPEPNMPTLAALEMPTAGLEIQVAPESMTGDALAADIEKSIAAIRLIWLASDHCAADALVWMSQGHNENRNPADGRHLKHEIESNIAQPSPHSLAMKSGPQQANERIISARSALEQLLMGTLALLSDMSTRPIAQQCTAIEDATATVEAWRRFGGTQSKCGKSSAGLMSIIPKTSTVTSDVVRNSVNVATTTRCGRVSKPRKLYGDEKKRESSDNSSGSSCKNVIVSAITSGCDMILHAAAPEKDQKKSGIILKLKRSRAELEDGEGVAGSGNSGIVQRPKRPRLVLRVSCSK
nr:hypothetical protein CFP56_33566 [Quercus suber]